MEVNSAPVAHLSAGQLGGRVGVGKPAALAAICAEMIDALQLLEKAALTGIVWPEVPFQLSSMIGRDVVRALRC